MRIASLVLCSLLAATAAAAPTKPAPAAPAAPPKLRGVDRVLPVSGLIVWLPLGWRPAILGEGNQSPSGVYRQQLFDELERHSAGQAEASVALSKVGDCAVFLAAARGNGAAAAAPAWLPPAWSAKGYFTGGEFAHACSSFRTGAYAVTIHLVGETVDAGTAVELTSVLNNIAIGANRKTYGQYPDNEVTPLTVTGFMVTLPVTPHWFARVQDSDEGPRDILFRIGADGAPVLHVELELAAAPRCAAALKGYLGKATKKAAYMPAGWSTRGLEIAGKKAWVGIGCLETGPSALRVFITSAAPLGAADAQAVSALLTVVAAAKLARDGTAALPYSGLTTKVLARQSDLVIALPMGPVDWEVMNFRSESADVFTRGRPASPLVWVWLQREQQACSVSVVAGVRRVAQPSYAPADWGAAYESTTDATEIDANLCRGKLGVRVRFPAAASLRDRADVRDLLAAIGAADKP